MPIANKYQLISLTMISLAYASLARKAQAESISLGVYPPITQVSGMPGDTIRSEIVVQNNAARSTTIQFVLQPFTAASSQDGTVSYLQQLPTFFRFIRLEVEGKEAKQITLGPGEKKAVTLNIDIPEKSASEDHYFSVLFMAQNPAREIISIPETINATSQITSGVASHVLLSVSPTATQRLSLASFTGPGFSQNSPIPFHVIVQNKDDHLSRIHGKIEIRNITGMKVDEVIIPETIILGKSSRVITGQPPRNIPKDINIKQSGSPITSTAIFANASLLPGVYRAELVLDSTSQARVLSGTHFFTVAPVYLLLILVLGLGLAFIVIKRVRKKLRQ